TRQKDAAMRPTLLAKLSSAFGVAVLSSLVLAPSSDAAPTSKGCPPDKVWSDSRGGCICAPGTTWDGASRTCISSCPAGKVQDPKGPRGTCIADPKTCPVNKRWSDAHGTCIVACPPGKIADAKGAACVVDPKSCAAGEQWSDAFGGCVPAC